jgi:hypothetical protein
LQPIKNQKNMDTKKLLQIATAYEQAAKKLREAAKLISTIETGTKPAPIKKSKGTKKPKQKKQVVKTGNRQLSLSGLTAALDKANANIEKALQ